MTREFDLIGEITQYTSLQITRSYSGIGSLELRVNRYARNADQLTKGRVIFPQGQTDRAYVIRHREIELDADGKITENWIVRAPSLKSWFSDRLTIPPAGQSQDKVKAPAETAMYHYANTQAINPVDAGNVLPITAGVDQARGDAIEWESRYKDLAEEMTKISELSGLGWNIGVDYEAKGFVFNVTQGRDLTAGQSLLPPAIFSPEFGTLKQMSYVESDLDFKNVAVVAGQGEGADRRIVTVGDLSATGLDRRVLFVDARDVAEETEDDPPVPLSPAQIEESLRNRGLQKLAEHAQEIFLEGQAFITAKEHRLPKESSYGLTLENAINVVKEGNHLVLNSMRDYFITQFQPQEAVVSGSNTLPAIDLSGIGHYVYSKFTYTATTPIGTSVLVQISDDGVNWSTVENGGSLPFKRGEALGGRKLYVRQLFFTRDPDAKPRLTDFNLTIRGYKTSQRKVLTAGSLEYEKDFDLGDLVTLRNREWGVTMDARITEVKEIYEPGNISLEMTFGNSQPTLITKIKQEISGIRTELTR